MSTGFSISPHVVNALDEQEHPRKHLYSLPRGGRDDRHRHLRVVQHAIIHRLEHLDESDAPQRTPEMSDVREVGSLRIPHHIRLTDLKRNRVTEASIIQIDVDFGIQDAIFSVTQLVRQ